MGAQRAFSCPIGKVLFLQALPRHFRSKAMGLQYQCQVLLIAPCTCCHSVIVSICLNLATVKSVLAPLDSTFGPKAAQRAV